MVIGVVKLARKATLWIGLVLAVAIALALPVSGFATTPHEDGEQSDAPAVATVTPPLVAPSVARSSFQADPACSPGARTLSNPGARVYPEMGNGGYTSVHTDVTMNYDAPTNMFLPGTKVDLTVTSTQCLSELSFDFERTNASTAGGTGPDMTVGSIEINGVPATFTFVQPTYPGDPNGPNDPDPAAHEISNSNPVSATNPNPPACSPQVSNNTQNGLPCPADKLVVTPFVGIPSGTTFTVTINYTGRPGVHVDGDGSTEGWFRVNATAAPNDGAFVTTEPVGTDSWMPLNNHPSAKPNYDFYDTTNIGKTAVAAGVLVGSTPPTDVAPNTYPLAPTSVNGPDANFPTGSWTWHWHEEDPIANYLVENSIGSYDLTARTSPTSGIQYFQAMASGLLPARKTTIKANLDQQEDITEFQKLFNGPWPFTSNGILVALPSVGFAEEMQSKITFGNGATSTPSVGTINHENMHQWFGDNVSEASFNLTFWKEGFATLGEYLNTARTAANGAGGLGTPAGDAAFENSLLGRFNTNYGTSSGTFWTSAPSNPTVGNLFTTAFTYTRPGTSYLALWRILGKDGMINAMKHIQSQYGGSSITEPQLEAVFRDWLPTPSASCSDRLDQFFPQWWDTAFPTGGSNTVNKPALTGPGLNGTGFVCAAVSPASPNGSNGWYTGDVSVTWQGYGASAATKTGCEDGSIVTDGTFNPSCSVTTTAAPILTSGAVSETIKRDATDPTIDLVSPADAAVYTQGQAVDADYSCSDATSGVDTCSGPVANGEALDTTVLGPHEFKVSATDKAGNPTSVSHTYTVVDTTAPVAAPTTAPAANGAGWNKTDVVVTWHWTDESGGSGIDTANCPASTTSVGEGTLLVQATCKDVSGNTGTGSVTVKVDKTAPMFTHANVSVDASSPGGANVGYTPSPTDPGGSGIATVTCAPLSGTLFAIGDTTVDCTATDVAGNSTPASFTIHVRSATEQLASLLTAVTGVGPGHALADQVKSIQKHVAENQTGDACRELGDFIRQVNALAKGTKPKITAAQATLFRAKAHQIELTLGC